MHVVRGDSEDPVGDFIAINQELELFNPKLALKTQVRAIQHCTVQYDIQYNAMLYYSSFIISLFSLILHFLPLPYLLSTFRNSYYYYYSYCFSLPSLSFCFFGLGGSDKQDRYS